MRNECHPLDENVTDRVFRAIDYDGTLGPSNATSQVPGTGELRAAEIEARRALGRMGQEFGVPERGPADAHVTRGQSNMHSPDGHRRRFVRDGEVPVVIGRVAKGGGSASAAAAAAPTNRLAISEAALDNERLARQRAERALGEAQAAVRDLQTKLGHLVLARDEAVETASQLREENQRLAEALAAEQQARADAEHALERALGVHERVAARRLARENPDSAAEPGAILPKRRGRPPKIRDIVLQPAGVELPVKRRGRPPKVREPGSAEPVGKPRGKEPKPVRWW